jgi:hypothetical protein
MPSWVPSPGWVPSIVWSGPQVSAPDRERQLTAVVDCYRNVEVAQLAVREPVQGVGAQVEVFLKCALVACLEAERESPNVPGCYG